MISAIAAGKAANQMFNTIVSRRRARGVDMGNITASCRFLRGKPQRRGKVETRGRKRAFTRRIVLATGAARRKFIKDTKGTRQAKWQAVRAKARVPVAHSSTVARAFAREGIGAKLRPIREKPQRSAEHGLERVDMCGKLWRWYVANFTDGIDLIMVNKKFEIPTTPAARAHLDKQKMHTQLRARSEGWQPHFTKPRATTHRRNLGGYAMVCAGISNCQVAMWGYCKKWNACVAADLYKGGRPSTH